MSKRLKLFLVVGMFGLITVSSATLYDPSERPPFWEAIRAQDNPTLSEYMVISSKEHSHLVIDDSMLNVGDSFGGGKITTISASSITIMRNEQLEHIDLEKDIKYNLQGAEEQKEIQP